MGIYSEKLIEEAKKNKIDTTRSDFSLVDAQIENILKKMQDSMINESIDIKEFNGLIFHRMENNIEEFMDSNGGINTANINKTVSVIVEENKKSEITNVEDDDRKKTEESNNKEIPQQVAESSVDEVEGNRAERDEDWNNFWDENGEKIIDGFDNLDPEITEIGENTYAHEKIGSVADLWNFHTKDPKQLIDALKQFADSPEATPEEKEKIIEQLKNNTDPFTIRKGIFHNRPGDMRIIISGIVGKPGSKVEDLQKALEKEGFSEERIKELLLTGVIHDKSLYGYYSLKEAWELRKIDGSLEVLEQEWDELEKCQSPEELRLYCEKKGIQYIEGMKKEDIQEAVFEEEIDFATKRKSELLSIPAEKRKLYESTPFYKGLEKMFHDSDYLDPLQFATFVKNERIG